MGSPSAAEMAAVSAKANALAAAALCQQRRQDWAAAAKAKAERLEASAAPRAEEAAPRRPLAPFTHHNHATSRPTASPDGGGCGVWLQAPRPPAAAALPRAAINGCGGASSLVGVAGVRSSMGAAAAIGGGAGGAV